MNIFKLPNKHKYSIQRAIQLILSPLFSIISLFLKKREIIIFTSSLNNEFSDNSRALFEYLYKNPQYKDRLFFVLNDPQKREFYNQRYPNKFISNLSLKNILFILSAKYWFCTSLELPVAGILQRKMREVVHLGHGMPYKRIGLMEYQVSWYKKLYYKIITSNFSYSFATTSFYKTIIAKSFGLPNERVLLLPQPKTGQVAEPVAIENTLLKNKEKTHILYAPTWRPYGEVELFPFPDRDLEKLSQYLKSKKTHLWLRLHPRFEHKIPKNILTLPNIHLFSAKEYPEINQYLAYFDAMITDYSSIYFDFLPLHRPVLFFDYDVETYNEKVGIIDDFSKVKCTPSTKTQEEFYQQIEAITQGTFDITGAVEANKIANYSISTNEILDYLSKKLF